MGKFNIEKNPFDSSTMLWTVVGIGGVVLAWYLLKDKTTTGFTLHQPTANPEIIEPGNTTVISEEITSLYDKEVTVDVKIEIYEAGFLWNTSKKLESKTVTLTIPVGETMTAKMSHVGTTGGTTNSSGINMRAVGITTYVDGVKIGASWEADDVFGVQVGQGTMGITMLNPIIEPNEIPTGETCHITCPVQNVGTQSVQVKSEVRIINVGTDTTSENGMLESSSVKTIEPGETVNFEFDWISGATLGGKWLVESLYMSTGELAPYTGPTNPNIFKQKFDVVDNVASFDYNNPVKINSAKIGDTVTITLPIKNTSGRVVVVTPVVYMHEGSVLSSPGDQIGNSIYPSKISFSSGQTKNIEFSWVVAGASDRKDVILKLYEDRTFISSNHYDDIIRYVTSNYSEMSVSLEQPYALPEPSVLGNSIDIYCPIGFVGGDSSMIVLVKVHIAESSIWATPGTELIVFSGYMPVTPGDTQIISSTWKTSGAAGSKDITVEVYSYPDNVLLESNNFDDAFHVN
jgi:hypothetical protein